LVKDIVLKPEYVSDIEMEAKEVMKILCFVASGIILDDPVDWIDDICVMCDRLSNKVLRIGKISIFDKFEVANESNWWEFIPFYDNKLHRMCKFYDEELQRVMKFLLREIKLQRNILYKIMMTR